MARLRLTSPSARPFSPPALITRSRLRARPRLQAFERLGAQLAEADVELLFYAFATAPDGGGGDGHGDAAPYVAYHHFIEAMTSADGGLLRGARARGRAGAQCSDVEFCPRVCKGRAL
jgi:hypothetical protein